ncbi:polysaccharide pyruvyl transferase family protein [Flavicella sp.]|uniref:polysaccharide pyruvyl transferase family protein n=1 Tax=Flavicella sp. TaxID=2957742 RepID=UPI003019C25C
MIIQIDGTNTLNKGAELMLIAIIEQIEKKFPDALVVYNSNDIGEKNIQLDTSLVLKQRFWLKKARIPVAILHRLKLPYTFFTSKHPLKNVDLVLDGAGFQFSDQWNYSKDRLLTLENYYKNLKHNGTKIVLLPQALGPFDTKSGKDSMKIVNEFTDVIIARERVSFEYAVQAGVNKNKLWKYSDFTLLTKGVLLEKFEYLKGKVCVVPNKKMVTHTNANSNDYLRFLKNVILEFEKQGQNVFLLNHEGLGDLDICRQINNLVDNRLDIITGLNAKEVKGVIGASYVTVSSRFHGVASSLNQGVPCLATSWNHKYEMLFEDFGQKDRLINVNDDWEITVGRIKSLLKNHGKIKTTLIENKLRVSVEIERMWADIWSKVHL